MCLFSVRRLGVFGHKIEEGRCLFFEKSIEAGVSNSFHIRHLKQALKIRKKIIHKFSSENRNILVGTTGNVLKMTPKVELFENTVHMGETQYFRKCHASAHVHHGHMKQFCTCISRCQEQQCVMAPGPYASWSW